jgi:heavy metal translocating P-type ATPase
MSSCCQCKAPDAGAREPVRTLGWMRLAIAGFVAAQSMIFSLAVNISPPAEPARTALHAALALSAVVVFLLLGLPLLRAAWSGARRGRIVFEQLFLVGIFGAFGASLVSTFTGTGHVYYEIVAILLAIHTFGRILGDNRRSAALEAANALGREFDSCERVDAGGRISTVPVRNVRIGDTVLVAAGAAIPVDGTVITGTALVNESALTGEPFPVVKREGDTALAGSHSLDGALRIRVTDTSRRLDTILSRVATARSHPSRLEREADRLVVWFLPVVLTISTATFVFWTLRSGWVVGLFNALAVVLVACPCSMGLATPIAIWSALADLARRGLVARDSDLVERLAGIDAVFFDKTGTLGQERLDIVDFAAAPGIDRGELLREVASLEAASNHPIALAFRSHATGSDARDVRLIPGVGIAGRVGDTEIQIGNTPPPDDTLSDLLRESGAASHMLYIQRNRAPAGIALLRERLRDSSSQTLSALDAAGIPWAVLTGGRDDTLGLANTHTGLSPEAKIDRMRAFSSRALFVGDGINDAPAMAEAHVSLCISGGSAVASEAAMGEVHDLREIPHAIARCRATVRAIRRNLLFAATYNFIGITLAACGLLHPVAAALLMLVSSFTVSWLALREPRVESQPVAAIHPIARHEMEVARA